MDHNLRAGRLAYVVECADMVVVAVRQKDELQLQPFVLQNVEDCARLRRRIDQKGVLRFVVAQDIAVVVHIAEVEHFKKHMRSPFDFIDFLIVCTASRHIHL